MEASRRAILIGWALGVFEAGQVLSSVLHFVASPWAIAMAILMPMLVYGWGGWILSRLPGAERYPWGTLGFLGAVVLIHLRRHLYLGTDGLFELFGVGSGDMGLVALGALAGLCLWYLARDGERRSRTWSALDTLLAAYAFLRLRAFAHNRPPAPRGWLDLGQPGFSFGGDWGWALFGLLLLAWIWLVPPRSRRAPAWVPRVSLAALVVPPFALGYLWVTLEKEPLVSPAPASAAAVAPEGAPSVLLMSWDTVRADTLPPYGGGGLATPNLDRLVARGVLFERYHTNVPLTGPAHNSMLTGLYPPSHGVRYNGVAVNPLLKRLPEVFRDRGWSTSAFVSGLPVRREYGFQAGFEVFDDRAKITPLLPLYLAGGFLYRTVVVFDRLLPANMEFMTISTSGDVTADRAVAWIGEHSEPFFAWAHLFDAHDPRDVTGPFAEYVARARARAAEGPQAPNPKCQESWILQRAEIEFLDHQLGRILDALEARDPGLANTVIALVADHGECFGEGAAQPELFGEDGLTVLHAPSLYEATQHVVCVIKPQASLEDAVPAGTRLPTGDASHIDLMPTLLELAGLRLPEGIRIQGRSLVPLLRGQSRPERGTYLEAFGDSAQDKRLQGWIEGDWKYIRSEDGAHEYLFRIGEGDARDYAAEEPERLQRMKAALRQAYEEMPKIDGVATRGGAGLAALGYVDGEN